GRTSATQTSAAYGPEIGNEEDPPLRPMIIFEIQTRLQKRMTRQSTIGTRRIRFKGDHTSTSMPTNLPHSPNKVTWKRKAAMTSNQLQTEATEKKTEKVMERKGK
ncbi:hypothetical protein A4A49_64952, partial [Nicotiana attenuata]